MYPYFCSMTKIAFISGATAGIGYACAYRFAKAGFNVIITGRRKERLDSLKALLEKDFGIQVYILQFDVQQKDEVFSNIGALPDDWKNVDVLVNNAGLALGRDSFENADLQDWDTMLATNVNGLLYVSRAILPFMIKRKSGHIINIGSIAGKEVYENGNVYCASKFAVDALTRSMRIDLLKHSIKVTGIHPGAVETEFSLVRFKGDTEKSSAAYAGYYPLSAEDIADTVLYVAQQPSHVCINEINITCTQQANVYYFNKNQ